MTLTESPQVPRGRPRSVEVDDRIREAALALLGEVGYQRLALEQVALRAGIGKAAIYRRWASKADMVLTLVLHDAQLPPYPDSGSLLGDLTAVLTRMMSNFSTPVARRIVPGLLAEFADQPELAERFQQIFNAEELRVLGLIMDRALARGELAAKPDPVEAHMLLTGPLMMWLYVYRREASPNYVSQLATQVTQALQATRTA